jgi:hypothetical protein
VTRTRAQHSQKNRDGEEVFAETRGINRASPSPKIGDGDAPHAMSSEVLSITGTGYLKARWRAGALRPWIYAAPVPGRWRDNAVNDQFLIIPTRGYAFPPPCPLKINFFLIQFQIPLFEGKWCQMGAQGGSQNPQKSVKIWKSAPQSAFWDGT